MFPNLRMSHWHLNQRVSLDNVQIQQIRIPCVPSEDIWPALPLRSRVLCWLLLSLLPADDLQLGSSSSQSGPPPGSGQGQDEEEEEMVQYILDFVFNETLFPSHTVLIINVNFLVAPILQQVISRAASGLSLFSKSPVSFLIVKCNARHVLVWAARGKLLLRLGTIEILTLSSPWSVTQALGWGWRHQFSPAWENNASWAQTKRYKWLIQTPRDIYNGSAICWTEILLSFFAKI